MSFQRSSGVILHPTSLPGPYGIGDIGPQAHRWVDFLSKAGCAVWQVLPLGPTGYGDSPYQCFSAFAGNPYLISPEELIADGLLQTTDLANTPDFPRERVDFGWIIPWKVTLLDQAFERFQQSASSQLRGEWVDFRHAQAGWLDDFALFMAIKDAHGGAPWSTWEPELRSHEPAALEKARQYLTMSVERQIFRQFIFYRQWQTLRAQAHTLGIQIIGDIPIFVAHDSADVWAHPELFYMDDTGHPTVVAGVPPDYFSSTGQLWGNPLYRWNVHAATGYEWWLQRIRAVLDLVDIIRIDHFRGFAGYWEVPGDSTTAVNGHWVPGPGVHFFQVVQQALGVLPIIAEDLGIITPDVEQLRDTFELPGMKVLQFAFSGDPSQTYLPHNYGGNKLCHNCVVYTGTHDNDTGHGWYDRIANTTEGDFFRRYLGCNGDNAAWDLIRLAWSSVAVFALAPLQDFLNLGNKARMNYPGNPSGNWSWRMPENSLSEDLRMGISEMNHLYSRKKAL